MVDHVNLQRSHIAAITKVYSPESKYEGVLDSLNILLKTREKISPLFLRFAIEQILENPNKTLTEQALIGDYIEALRDGKLDIYQEDFQRLSKVVAHHSLSQEGWEFSEDFMRGVLSNTNSPFFRVDGKTVLTPVELISMLESSGLLERKPINRHLQFTYDPVAEKLAKQYCQDNQTLEKHDTNKLAT